MEAIVELDFFVKSALIEKCLVEDFETYRCTLFGYEFGKMSVEEYCRDSSIFLSTTSLS
jgi:hypothetical protein